MDRRRLLTDLLLFTAITFAITWLVVGVYIWRPEEMTELFGPMRLGAPAFYVAVYAPSVTALLLTAIRYGRRGLTDLLASVVRVRAAWKWIAISVFGFAGLWLVVSLIEAAARGNLAAFDDTPWLVALPLVILGGHILTDPGALGEELGWRGFALPRLLLFLDARSAALFLGVVWAVWHLPAFYVGSLSQSAYEFLPFVLRVTAYSVFMTWLFVNTRGSVLWAGIVPHMFFNAVSNAGIQPVGWISILAGVVIAVLAGRHMRGIGKPAASLPQFRVLDSAARAA